MATFTVNYDSFKGFEIQFMMKFELSREVLLGARNVCLGVYL